MKRTLTYNFIYRYAIAVCLLLIASSIVKSENTADHHVFQTIISRIQDDNHKVDIPRVEGDITEYLHMIREDGSFPDLDYTSRAQTNWKPLIHLNRLMTMSVGYTAGTGFKNDPDLFRHISNALQFWYDKHPTSTNWFQQQIGCPQRVGVILILLRGGEQQLSKVLENKLIERMRTEGGAPDQPGSQGTGANKLAIATHWVYRGCLTEDHEVLSFGIGQAYYPVHFTLGQGIQYDYSYQQHGKQLHIGGYGTGVADDISKLATYMIGTPYALPAEKLELFCGFVRNAYIPVIRGRYYLYNVLGRGLSRPDGLDQTSFVPILERMIKLDPKHSRVYSESISRITESVKSSYVLEPMNTHFWCSDYTLHQRPDYTFDVRMASVFTARNENGNGENLKGYFLTEGATSIVKDGDEYVNIFPVWDWSKIPGTTTPEYAVIPLPGQWEKKGSSTFAGGVSDGKYGVTAYSMNEKTFGIDTRAKKSWFLFEDEIVCLGAGIYSDNENDISTTVNQCLLQEEVIIHSDGESSTAGSGTHSFTSPGWVYHKGIGYYFPEGGDIIISNQSQSGSWASINSAAPDSIVSKDVLRIGLRHGNKPLNAAYSYIIVPTLTNKHEAARYQPGDLSILSNTRSLQAVVHNNLHIAGVTFHDPGVFTGPGFSIESDGSCVIMVTGLHTSHIRLYIADPSRTTPVITLKATIHATGKQIKQVIEFPVHPDPHAGSTLLYSINPYDQSFQRISYEESESTRMIY